MAKTLVLVVLFFGLASSNHPRHHGGHGGGHHGGHHHMTPGAAQPQPQSPTVPYVSSFSHALPGQGSFMSISRVFQVPRGHPQATPPEVLRTFSGLNLGLSPFHPDHQGGEAEPEEEQRSSAQPEVPFFNPWDPRFKIPRLEATDDDWEELLGEVFEESGLLDPVNGKILRQVPKGLVNLNYDIHVCVHMGTELDPEDSAYPPTAISYPDDTNDSVNASSILHTLVMIDVDLNNKLHWMVTNIPGAKVNEGQTIATYASPNPAGGTGSHRYVILVMEQTTGLPVASEQVASYKSTSSCDLANRENFDLQAFREALALSEPVAANYFTLAYTPFVDDLNSNCLGEVPLQPHPLHR